MFPIASENATWRLPNGCGLHIFASMALEIRRTPVLYGEEARRFLKEIENPKPSKISREEALESLKQARAIWAEYRANKEK